MKAFLRGGRVVRATAPLLLLWGLASLGCDRAHDQAEPKPAPEPASQQKQPQKQKPAPKKNTARGLAWKVTSGDRTLYLVGSIHVGKPQLYPLPDAIDEAFEKSSILVEEIDVFEAKKPEKLALLTQSASFPPGDTLDKHLSPEVMKLYETSSATALFGPAGRTLRPWFLSIAVTMQALESKGYLAELGIDQHFATRALEKNMKYQAIETVEGQVAALAGLPDATQELMLADTLEQLPELAPDMEKTLSAWISGDAAAVEAIMMESMRKEEYKPVYEALFLQRNKAMKQAILRYLATPAVEFIVLGSGHLVGEDGLVKTLAGDGRKIERL